MGNATAALQELVQPSSLLFLLIGVVSGLVIGLLPGMGGTAAVSLLLPFVFSLNLPVAHGMTLLIGAVAVVHHSDVITAILFGIAGTPATAATLLDGHEMAKNGEAARALSLSFLCSMAGGLIGAVALTFTIPISRPVILAFGSPEVFMLTVLGVGLAGLLSRGSMIKGLVAATLGLALGFVGVAPAAPVYRFTFGSLYLHNGISLAAVALGIFGIAEIVVLMMNRASIAADTSLSGGWAEGARDFLRYWYLVIRGAATGVAAGLIPAVGGSAGAFLAYGQTVATAKDKSRFGKGDPRGVVGPESANNSVECGDLIPTFLFGIPGGTPAALLLGALLFYGLQPGPQLMTQHLDVVYNIVWSFALASVIGSLLCFPLSRPLARLTHVPLQSLAPALLLVMMLGAFQSFQSLGDLVTLLVMGILGASLRATGIPRAPFLIGFVLSGPLERYYFLTANLYTFHDWIRRPIVDVILVILVLPIAVGLVRFFVKRRPRGTGDAEVRRGADSVDDEAFASAGREDGRLTAPVHGWTIVMALVALSACIAALIISSGYPSDARLAPRLVGIAGVVVCLLLLVRSAVGLRGRASPRLLVTEWTSGGTRAAGGFAIIGALIVVTHFVGFIVATALFLPLFLRWVAHAGLVQCALQTIVLVGLLAFVGYYSGIVVPAGVWFTVY